MEKRATSCRVIKRTKENPCNALEESEGGYESVAALFHLFGCPDQFLP